MKVLLRSCFLAASSDDEELFQRNYLALLASDLGFETPEDDLLWTFIKDFFQQHMHVPTLATIRAHFERIKEMEAVDRVETVANFTPLTRGDFVRHLEEKAEDRRSRLLLEYAKTMVKIVETGIEVRDGKNKKFLKGAVDACRYFSDLSHGILAPTLGARMSGDLLADTVGFREHYERVEADPEYGIGLFSGLEQMDKVIAGAKRGELWIHAGFTGAMKTTLALHWAYVQAIYFKHTVFYCSLEMPLVQCRNIVHTMHSYHEKFRADRIRLGIQAPSKKQTDGTVFHYDRGLDYEKIKNGKLAPNEKAFLMDVVERDLDDATNEYGDIHLEGADPDKTDYTIVDLRTKAETQYAKQPFDLMFIDHMGLMAPRRRMGSTTENLNEVVRDIKKMALGFNRGMGIPIVGLWQVSRSGWREAAKTDGKYNLTVLSYANECLVAGTPVWTDEGMVPVEQVKPGMRVWSRDGWKDVLDFFEQGERDIWRVDTDRGAMLEGTATHRVRVLVNGDVAWKQIDQLQEGDWLLSTRGDYPFSSQDDALLPLEIRKWEKPRGERGVALTVPERLTEELAWLLGAWDGDGKCHKQAVAFTGNRKETCVRDRICATFEQCFSHPLGVQESPSRSGSFDLMKWSQPLQRWLAQLAGPRGKAIPSIIRRAPKHLALAYLKGLWDTDGWVNNQYVIGLQMKSESYLREIQVLMTALGYDSHLCSRWTTLKATEKRYKEWVLRLRGKESTRRFAEEIGFTEPWKMSRVQESLTRGEWDKRMYPVGSLFYKLSLPLSPYRLLKGRATQGFAVQHQRAKHNRTVSHGGILTLLRLLREEGRWSEGAQFLEDLVTRMHVTKVAAVHKANRVAPVFDIQVAGDHEYQSGLLLSHNCERSADVVTVSWIDDELKAQGRFFMQCLKSRDTAPFERFPVRVEFHCRRLLTDHEGIEDSDEAKQKRNEEVANELDELFA